MNRKGIELVKSFEGCRLKAYRCPAGVWTIGYGHTAGVREGMEITQEVADMLLAEDLDRFEKNVSALVEGVALNPNQLSALVSFAYNLGVGSLQKSTLLNKVKANPCDPNIASEFLRWVRAGGKVLRGLVRRRNAEANLYFDKDF